MHWALPLPPPLALVSIYIILRCEEERTRREVQCSVWMSAKLLSWLVGGGGGYD